jgi:hypothetical protein
MSLTKRWILDTYGDFPHDYTDDDPWEHPDSLPDPEDRPWLTGRLEYPSTEFALRVLDADHERPF